MTGSDQLPSPQTPSTVLDTWELHSDLAKIEQQWAPLFTILEDDGGFSERDPRISAWSAGEQAGHLAIVCIRISGIIRNHLANPEQDRDEEWSQYTRPIFESGIAPRGVAKAPPPVQPRDRTRRELLRILRMARTRWRKIIDRADRLSACPARTEHFIFGYLTSTDWVRFCAFHNAHHLRIIEDIQNAGRRVDGQPVD